jgi:hypothetical protein
MSGTEPREHITYVDGYPRSLDAAVALPVMLMAGTAGWCVYSVMNGHSGQAGWTAAGLVANACWFIIKCIEYLRDGTP